MVRSVFLGVMSQPRNPRQNNGLVSPATEVSLEIEKPPFWKRGPEGRLPPSSAQPSSLLFRNPLLVSLNNSQDLLFPPNPSLHPTSPALPGLPSFRGKVTGRGHGQRGEGEGAVGRQKVDGNGRQRE